MEISACYDIAIDALDNALDNDQPVISVENNGIGHYEFWGATGFDKGQDIPFIDEGDREVVVSFPWSARLIKKVVEYWNDCTPYKSYIYAICDYENIHINYTVKSVEAVAGGIKFVIEWGEVEG